MKNLRKITLMEHSKVMESTLRWNPEKFQNWNIIPDPETIQFFETVLNRDCGCLLHDFFKLLAGPLTYFLYFF